MLRLNVHVLLSITKCILKRAISPLQVIIISHSSPAKAMHEDKLFRELRAIKSQQDRIGDLLYSILEHQKREVSFHIPPQTFSTMPPRAISLTPPRPISIAPLQPLSTIPLQPSTSTFIQPQPPLIGGTDDIPPTPQPNPTPPHPPTTPTDVHPVDPAAAFDPTYLARLKRESCSWANFATNLVRKAFSADVRRTSNVRGQGKPALDPVIMAEIENTTFMQYPLETGEKRKIAWSVCVKAIDESARRLRRRERD